MKSLLHTVKSNRHCVVEHQHRISLPAVKRRLLAGDAAGNRFVTIDAHLPATRKTSFGVYATSRELLIAVCLRDPGAAPVFDDTIEILFSPYDDEIGYYQFVFAPEKPIVKIHHVPYDIAHSTAYKHIQVRKIRWDLPAWATKDRETGKRRADRDAPAWLFAWFRIDDVFRAGDRAGFNIARSHRAPSELSSWNPCTGHGPQDATGLGKLYLKPPVTWACELDAQRSTTELVLKGHLGKTGQRLAFNLKDPLDNLLPVSVTQRAGQWTVRANLPKTAAGRFRLYAKARQGFSEPRFVAADIPAIATPFKVTMTYDIPMDVGSAPVAYTPAALGAELDLYRDHGINRIHWIDVPPEKMYPRANRPRSPLSVQTERNCGDLLPLAASLAKARGMEFFGIFKPFDMAIDGMRWGAKDVSLPPNECIENLEGVRMWALPAIRDHQDCTMQVHDEWHPPTTPHPTRIRIYSRDPIPRFNRHDLRLWVSADNGTYRPYRGGFDLRQGRLRRAHQRWTPAGNLPESTREMNDYLEVDGLKLTAPFAAIEIRNGARLTHRAHAFMAAWDATGAPVPVTLGTAGNLEIGFSYWQEWQSWANKSPRMLEDVTWGPGPHGVVFQLRRNRPTLLEMTFETTRDIWLRNVQRILETDATGVCIRTLCHHNNVMDHMVMAFAGSVREAFRKRHGRDPEPTWDDCVRVREIRGEAFTRFLRDAKDLTRKAGKKLAIHLEAGFEIPPQYDQRMQFNMEWETWIREDIADELTLKWWTSQSPFIHERVLPLARRRGIPVHVVDRNYSLLRSPRAMERAVKLLRDAAAAGFAGYAWYESANYKRRNTENIPEFRGLAGDAIRVSAHQVKE